MIMEYQKLINLLYNTPNQPFKFKTKAWVEIDDDSPGTYNTNNQTKFETIMLKSSLCDYSDVYTLAKGNITVPYTAGAGQPANNNSIEVGEPLLRFLEMPSINCEINLILTWFKNCVISNDAANQAATFTTTDTKCYVPIVTLLTQDNAKLLQGFKRTINWINFSNKSNDTVAKSIFRLLD